MFGMSKRAAYRIVWILSALAIFGMTFVFASQPFALPPPGPITSYTTRDKSLSLKRPGNWKGHESSMNGIETQVRFDPVRNAHLILISDLKGSLIADIEKSLGSAGDTLREIPGMDRVSLPKPPTPLESMHARQGKELAGDKTMYSGFQDGETRQIQIDRYEALLTDFSFQEPGAFGSRPMVGRRITLLAGERRVTIVYSCLKEMRALLMPLFDQVRDSVTVGQPGG